MRFRRSYPVPFPPTVLPVVALLFALGVALTPGRDWAARAREFFLGGHGAAGYLWFLGLWALTMELHVAVHEAGHALVGLAAGYRVVSVDLGLVRLEFHPRWQVTRQRDGRFLFAGLTRALAWRASSRARRAAFAAGGPAASLLAGVALAALTLQAPWPWWAGSLRVATGLASLFGLYMCIGALVPRSLGRLGGLPSDGALILQVLRDSGPQAPLWVLQVLGGTNLGLRPRDSGAEPARAAAEATAQPGPNQFHLVLAAALALDHAQLDLAEPLLVQGLTLQGEGPPASLDLLSMAAQFYALCRPDLPRARALLERLLAAPRGADYGRLASACVALAEGRQTDAVRERDAWLAWVDTTPSPTAILAGNEWALDRLAGLEPAPKLPEAPGPRMVGPQ